MPYRSVAFKQTHPDRLATLARIFRLTTPDVAACRVLELGCASGGNLLPMAYNLPHSEFVGVDASRRQVDEGQAAIRALGLHNVTIECASILDVTPEYGRFDYIICHGVFSWVEPAVQDAVLRIASDQLTPNGLAYVSYNTYPGWHLRESVRHMMRYHAGQFTGAHEQVEQARALLDFLVSASDQSGPYHELLEREVDRLRRAPDSYLFHEHLERTNLPLYFHQFVERAEKAGLQYLCESTISEMLLTRFPAAVAETLERISPDLLHLEQYMDFIRNRQFRQTLLCREGAHPIRTLSPDVLRGLLLSSSARAPGSVDLEPGRAVVFTNGVQRAEVASPATKAAFSVLIDEYPLPVRFEELCAAALSRAASRIDSAPAAARGRMEEDLLGAVMYGLIQMHTHAPPCTNRVSDRPRGYPVALWHAKAGEALTNAHHEMVELDQFAVEVLTLADGKRTPAAITEWFVRAFERGDLGLDQDGVPITGREPAREMLGAKVELALALLARNALLVE